MTGSPDACPEYFLQNAHRQGTFVQCGANTLEDLWRNLEQKAAHRHPTHGAKSTNGLPWWIVVAVAAGCVALLSVVLCRLRAPELRAFMCTGFPPHNYAMSKPHIRREL
eukprot:COSAG02_NODE_6800_length_3354_cov_6.480184_2_plen_109_part_00